MARPLFIYSDAGIMAEKPQVADFINFYLTFVNEEVIDVGYFPASPAALGCCEVCFLGAMGMEGNACLLVAMRWLQWICPPLTPWM